MVNPGILYVDFENQDIKISNNYAEIKIDKNLIKALLKTNKVVYFENMTFTGDVVRPKASAVLNVSARLENECTYNFVIMQARTIHYFFIEVNAENDFIRFNKFSQLIAPEAMMLKNTELK